VWLSEYRTLAAQQYLQQHPEVDTIIASGAKVPQLSLSDAEFIRQFLKNDRSPILPSHINIIKDESSYSTIDQFLYLRSFFKNHPDANVIVITSRFHVARCELLRKRYVSEYPVSILSAEELVPRYHRKVAFTIPLGEFFIRLATAIPLGEKFIRWSAHKSRHL